MASKEEPVTSQPMTYNEYPQVPQPPAPYPQPQALPFAPQPTTTIVQVNQTANEPQIPYPQNMQPWTTGICDCFSDCDVCLLGWCCPSCLACQVAADMGEPFCTPCCYGDVTAMRVKLRTMLGITGTIGNDTVVMGCCTPCGICQMKREMKNRGMC